MSYIDFNELATATLSSPAYEPVSDAEYEEGGVHMVAALHDRLAAIAADMELVSVELTLMKADCEAAAYDMRYPAAVRVAASLAADSARLSVESVTKVADSARKAATDVGTFFGSLTLEIQSSELEITDEASTIETKGAEFTCCICGETDYSPIRNGYQTTIGQNNPWPIIDDDDSVCCDGCNALYVIPARMRMHDSEALYQLADVMAANGCTEDAIDSLRDLAADAAEEMD